MFHHYKTGTATWPYATLVYTFLTNFTICDNGAQVMGGGSKWLEMRDEPKSHGIVFLLLLYYYPITSILNERFIAFYFNVLAPPAHSCVMRYAICQMNGEF